MMSDQMTRTRALQLTLYVIAAYMASFGVLFAFAPDVAGRITQSTLSDATLNLLYGQYALTFAVVAFMAARDSQPAGKLSLVVLLLTAGHVLVFGYVSMTGMWSCAQAGPPVAVNLVLTILLLLLRR